MSKDKIFIEPQASGGFGATHEGGNRLLLTGQTQGEVIQQAQAKFPSATVHIARVRNVGSGPDKFRKL